MFEEQIIFKDFTKSDYYGYSGVMDLPNGEKPKIYHHIKDDDHVADFIISGNGASDSLISMIVDGSEYLVCIPGFNMCHYAIVKSMIQYFDDYEIIPEAVEAIASDFCMINVMGG